MSFAEIKEKVVELSAQDRFKLAAYLAELEQESPRRSREKQNERVKLPLIHGDGSRIINPTPQELDASLWD